MGQLKIWKIIEEIVDEEGDEPGKIFTDEEIVIGGTKKDIIEKIIPIIWNLSIEDAKDLVKRGTYKIISINPYVFDGVKLIRKDK